jgi:hypothetical protein
MTITAMVEKNKVVNGGNIETRSLETIVGGGSEADFISDDTIVKIIEESKVGYYDKRISKNAIFVIMQRATKDEDGNIIDTDEAVQVPLSVFDRIAVPYTKDAEGMVVRNREKDTERASGSVVDAWKSSPNAAKFMETYESKYIHFKVKAEVDVRAWSRAANDWSQTELRSQKVFSANWVG